MCCPLISYLYGRKRVKVLVYVYDYKVNSYIHLIEFKEEENSEQEKGGLKWLFSNVDGRQKPAVSGCIRHVHKHVIWVYYVLTDFGSRDVHSHTRTLIHTQTHTHVHTLNYVHSHTRTLIHTHTHTHTHTYALNYVRAHTHLHTCTHTHVHTHVHTQPQLMWLTSWRTLSTASQHRCSRTCLQRKRRRRKLRGRVAERGAVIRVWEGSKGRVRKGAWMLPLHEALDRPQLQHQVCVYVCCVSVCVCVCVWVFVCGRACVTKKGEGWG